MSNIYVSIQLISPASGEMSTPYANCVPVLVLVSIQLISPASGEAFSCWGFDCACQVSIQLIFPASGEEIAIHLSYLRSRVSIQLISPASGEFNRSSAISNWLVSIQLISPASGEKRSLQPNANTGPSFHSTNFPSEWGVRL